MLVCNGSSTGRKSHPRGAPIARRRRPCICYRLLVILDESVRFVSERAQFHQLRADPVIARELEALRASSPMDARIAMLGNAVRVDPELVPRLTPRIERLRDAVGGRAIEAYVFHDHSVNALVFDERDLLMVAFSSGALSLLDDTEIDFVIGHELGHARFGHLELACGSLIHSGRLAPVSNMKLRAWQRAAEISADRAGLHLCGSLAAAASALFKTVSGLRIDATVDPTRFADQWNHLEREVAVAGSREHWNMSHPFPPLRMKAMQLYWQSLREGKHRAEVDREIDRCLAGMDPTAGNEDAMGDSLLSAFFFWGGLYVALADGVLHPSELERIASVAPAGVDAASLVASGTSCEACLQHFCDAVGQRRRKLSTVELHRILEGLIAVASADGQIDPSELRHLYRLCQALGLPPRACELLIANSSRSH
jgi:uncharacterized tellurite resistance protein B-like protein